MATQYTAVSTTPKGQKVGFFAGSKEAETRLFHVGAPIVRHYVGGVTGRTTLIAPTMPEEECFIAPG